MVGTGPDGWGTFLPGEKPPSFGRGGGNKGRDPTDRSSLHLPPPIPMGLVWMQPQWLEGGAQTKRDTRRWRCRTWIQRRIHVRINKDRRREGTSWTCWKKGCVHRNETGDNTHTRTQWEGKGGSNTSTNERVRGKRKTTSWTRTWKQIRSKGGRVSSMEKKHPLDHGWKRGCEAKTASLFHFDSCCVRQMKIDGRNGTSTAEPT